MSLWPGWHSPLLCWLGPPSPPPGASLGYHLCPSDLKRDGMGWWERGGLRGWGFVLKYILQRNGGTLCQEPLPQCQEAGPGQQCSHRNHMRTECPPGPAWNLVWPPTLHCVQTRANSYGTLASGCLAQIPLLGQGGPSSGQLAHLCISQPGLQNWCQGSRTQAKPEFLGRGIDRDLDGKALPGASWAGQGEDAGPGRGAWYVPMACMRTAWACYRQAAGRQQAPQDWRAVLGCGGDRETQKKSQDLGPSCPEEVLHRQPERI